MTDRSYPLLSVQDISKDFLVQGRCLDVVEHLSFDVAKGELLVVLGPSGCGKSTLLRIIAGLETPSSGKVLLNNTPIEGPGRDRGMIFQHYASFPWLTVLQNVEFGLKYRQDVTRGQWAEISRHYLSLVGLEGFENAYTAQLSGGMQQRLAIARTLAAHPDVLLMDEPFGALDTQNREFLQVQLLETRKATGQTIVFITHDVEEALFLADRIIILTARPARIKKEQLVQFQSPRTLDLKTSTEFFYLKRQILTFTRDEALKASVMLSVPKNGTSPRFREEKKFSARRHAGKNQ